jgi:hypothetical protein
MFADELFSTLEILPADVFTQCKSTPVNDLEYKIFRSRNGDVSSGQLLLCKDVLHQHTKRANYQADIWSPCLENSHTISEDADGHGWKVERDGEIDIEWITGTHAPHIVL